MRLSLVKSLNVKYNIICDEDDNLQDVIEKYIEIHMSHLPMLRSNWRG